MSSVHSISERVLVAFGSIFIVLDLVLHVLDWITTFIGFSLGGNELNPLTLWFINGVRNEYLGITIEKIVEIGFLVFVFYFMRALATKRFSILKYVGLFIFNIVLAYILIELVSAVSHNLIELGF